MYFEVEWNFTGYFWLVYNVHNWTLIICLRQNKRADLPGGVILICFHLFWKVIQQSVGLGWLGLSIGVGLCSIYIKL